jgi:hypothetical protein
MEEGWILWDAIVCMGFHLLGCEDMAIEQKLAQNLPPVLHVQVGILAKSVSVAAAEGHHILDPLHERVPHAC